LHKKSQDLGGPYVSYRTNKPSLLEEQTLTPLLLFIPPQAYRKASLKYHPDKTGRGDDDYVFLAVKAAHDALFDPVKRQAYDSTTLAFDDNIPPAGCPEKDFYDTYDGVFALNLRFDAKLRPEQQKKGKPKKSEKTSLESTPTLGDANAAIEDVNRFYEYWTHFDSWRDFSQAAAEELEVEMDGIESRYEKRWLQKEIDKRAKQLKRKEVARIQLLVERAMEADPRLRAERQARLAAKEEAAKRRKIEQALEVIQKEQDIKLEAERLVQEKIQKAEDKIEREKEKKLVRKARQSLRRMASASFEEFPESEPLWKDSYDMNQDVEFLCTSLNLCELDELNKKVEQKKEAAEALRFIQQRIQEVKAGESADKQTAIEERENTQVDNDKSTTDSPVNGPLPWTKEELSALAKAVKKYPPGGSSRWQQIALLVNNLCKQDDPRSKAECIEKYNSIARNSQNPAGGKPAFTNGKTTNGSTAETEPSTQPDDDDWTPEQDQQLQDGLALYPGTMEKNERWTNICKGVPGKAKKECVQRFKTIREALKGRK
jgi:DnaJ family protein C protein 2